MKKINELISCDYDFDIYGITDDSRSVKKGYLFITTKGYNVDHYDYIDDAIKNGCVLIISDRKINREFPHIIVDKNLNELFICLCEKFYDVDYEKIKTIGITGTDGKTTTSTIVKRIICDCSYMGTNGLEIFDRVYKTNNTTPVVNELYKNISMIINSNCKNLVMEVSSEALLHNRVNNFKYDIVGITNITGDHLNIHNSMKDYINCKLKILSLVKNSGYVVINGDDLNLKNIKGSNIIKFGFDDCNDYKIINVKYLNEYTIIKFCYEDNIFKIYSPFKGKFNVYNVLMAYIICSLFGIDSNVIINKIKTLDYVSGRSEILNFGQNFEIVLDYAHTINGIKNIISSFNNYKRKIVVTGCAGGREKEKRSIIGKFIIDNCDIAIFTMDDPRFENVNEIIDQMVGNNENYIRIIDRSKAIKYALSIALKGDVVLILGKGRDNYMAIKDKKINYSDYNVIKSFFQKK